MIFFFPSRRRHTRCSRDWSSDVCSSDLFASRTANQGNGAHGQNAGLHNVLHHPVGEPCRRGSRLHADRNTREKRRCGLFAKAPGGKIKRSEEHTSELQSRLHLVCRLLLEKKKKYCAHRSRFSTHSKHSIRPNKRL